MSYTRGWRDSTIGMSFALYASDSELISYSPFGSPSPTRSDLVRKKIKHHQQITCLTLALSYVHEGKQ